jgi:two-component system chemotaxis sensor kinase CheA
VDLGKYRNIFIDEATDHLAEISASLLRLEKELGCAEAIDSVFRMAHSIKGMAASLEYDAITEVAHGLEDRMQGIRTAGRVADGEELALLFRGLEALEAMVAVVRAEGAPPPRRPELVSALTGAEASKKKVLRPGLRS